MSKCQAFGSLLAAHSSPLKSQPKKDTKEHEVGSFVNLRALPGYHIAHRALLIAHCSSLLAPITIQRFPEDCMPKKPTIEDAQLIVQLYDLRREAEMRKARSWWAGEFFPQSADDFLKVAWATGTQENAWLRQVGGYWGMVASFVNNGVLNEQLFLAPGFSGELFVIYAKIHPFLKDLRQKLNDPNAFKDVETAVTHTKWGRDRLQFMIKRVETMRQKRAEQQAR
jgi:hypothetical protein